MPLTDPHRSTVRERLRPVIGDDSALDALMSQLPFDEAHEPVTKEYLRSMDIATKDFVRAEVREASNRTLTVMVTAMIALNGITVGVLSTMIATSH